MTEQISALLDGELSDEDGARQIEALRGDEGCRRAWATYHLIGDALRGDVKPGCAHAVALRLVDEPVVLCPSVRQRVRRERAWYAVSAAAGFAAVAFVAWTAVPMLADRQGAQIAAMKPAAVAAPVSVAANTPAPVPTVAVVAAPGGAPAQQVVAPDVENYLLAHQQFSTANAMQGVAPYVRLVSESTAEAGR